MADMPAINPPLAKPNDPDFKPYKRDPETLVRQWALPGTEGLRHRIGGLEKEDITTEPAEIIDLIRSQPETPRQNSIPKETLSDIRVKLDYHIKSTYLKKVNAMGGVKPVLKAWLELS